MPNFDISINVYLFLFIIFFSFISGFIIRRKQIAKKDRRIASLEQEMMQAYSELLDTQKLYCELEEKVRNTGNLPPSPVIPMQNTPEPADPKQGMSVADRMRKKQVWPDWLISNVIVLSCNLLKITDR